MFFLIVKPQPLRSNPFPYTTLFRSRSAMMTFGHQLIEGDAGINPNSFDKLRVRAAERNMEFPMAAGDVGELTLEKLDEVFDAVLGSKVVHLNQWLKRKINALMRAAGQARSEERRVGKEWRSRGPPE